MLIRETFVNKSKGYQFGESEPYEPYTDNVGRLFRDMQREYGRCVSSMYIEPRDGSKAPTRCGWVFEKTMRYEDARSGDRDATYIREVWVELLDRFEPQPPIEEPHAI